MLACFAVVVVLACEEQPEPVRQGCMNQHGPRSNTPTMRGLRSYRTGPKAEVVGCDVSSARTECPHKNPEMFFPRERPHAPSLLSFSGYCLYLTPGHPTRLEPQASSPSVKARQRQHGHSAQERDCHRRVLRRLRECCSTYRTVTHWEVVEGLVLSLRGIVILGSQDFGWARGLGRD